MNKIIFEKITQLIDKKKVQEAQFEISKLGPEYYKNPEYLYLRSKIFYKNNLYYIAIDTLLIALEFEESEKVYELLSEIYELLDNKELSKKILDMNSRLIAIKSLKEEMSGIYQKKN